MIALPCLLLFLQAEPQEGITPQALPVTHQGEGLAAKYPRDRGLVRDERVLLVEDFERDGLAERWSSVKELPGQLSLVASPEPVHAGKRSLRIDFSPGENTGGHLYRKLAKNHEKLHLRFYVFFPKGHGYVHHFVGLNGYHPATPWPQGGAGTRPRGDERFSTRVDLYGDWGATPPPGRWAFYSYWSEMRAAPDGHYWGNEPPGTKRSLARTGRWTCVELMLKCNDPEQDDGEQALWIDGRCLGRWGGYRWRKIPELGINGVWLLYYVTADAIRRSKGTLAAQLLYFDDVVVAREYIGPAIRRSQPR